MATITLEYDTENSTANKILSVIFAMDDLFKVKNITVEEPEKPNDETVKAMQDALDGNVTVCGNFDDYRRKTAQYA